MGEELQARLDGLHQGDVPAIIEVAQAIHDAGLWNEDVEETLGILAGASEVYQAWLAHIRGEASLTDGPAAGRDAE